MQAYMIRWWNVARDSYLTYVYVVGKVFSQPSDIEILQALIAKAKANPVQTDSSHLL